MGLAEIFLFILGGMLFIASFVLPEKKNEAVKSTKQEEEKIKACVETELNSIKERMEEMSEETASFSVEKTERAMERLANEKIMAVSEYSDTVLKEINRNHEEVMFLYDMLNDKHVSLKNTVQEVTKSAKQAEQTAKDAELAVKDAKETAETVMETVSHQAEAPEKKSEKPEKSGKSTAKKKTAKAAEVPADDVDIQFAAGADGMRNSNDRILALHKEGKSNMAIAKELGLGIGEVKLVIDLFEGM